MIIRIQIGARGDEGDGGCVCFGFFILAAIFITLNGKLLVSLTSVQPATLIIGISSY